MKHPERLQRAARWVYAGACVAPWAWRQWKRFRPKKRKKAPAPQAAGAPRVYRRFFTRDRSFDELVRPAKK